MGTGVQWLRVWAYLVTQLRFPSNQNQCLKMGTLRWREECIAFEIDANGTERMTVSVCWTSSGQIGYRGSDYGYTTIKGTGLLQLPLWASALGVER